MQRFIFIGGEDSVFLDDLRTGDQFINDAVVKYSIFTSQANAESNTSPLANATDVAMPYVAGSDGQYKGKILASLTSTLTKNTPYWIAVTVQVDGVQVDRPILSRVAAYKSEQACNC